MRLLTSHYGTCVFSSYLGMWMLCTHAVLSIVFWRILCISYCFYPFPFQLWLLISLLHSISFPFTFAFSIQGCCLLPFDYCSLLWFHLLCFRYTSSFSCIFNSGMFGSHVCSRFPILADSVILLYFCFYTRRLPF